MKNFFVIIALSILVVSCTKTDFLENQTTALNESQVFTDSSRIIQFLNGIYAQGTFGSSSDLYRGIGFEFNKRRWETHGNQETSYDDAEYSFSAATRPSVMLYQGTFSATNYGSNPKATDAWTVPYSNIRKCNLLLANVDNSPLSSAFKSRIIGEAKCLRAWYYMQLLIVYGGVPNVGDAVYGIEDLINVPRQNFSDLVDYISNELDSASNLLPIPGVPFTSGGYYDADYGHVTKGTAMGLKSRLLLYAASPLFNGGAISKATVEQIPLVSYPSYDVGRWKKAADAALAVINSKYYSLNVDNSKPGLGFYLLFLQRTNPENIFFVTRPLGRDFESYYLPSTRSGANNSRPTQDIVDAFPMKNGKSISDITSGYDPQKPYINRDPRFNYSIIFNGSKFQSNGSAQDFIWTFTGTGQSGDAFSTGGNTGYFCRKMCDSTITGSVGASHSCDWPLMRYAEILLNYAEAVNEIGQPAIAYPYLKSLRARAGIDAGNDGMYGMKQSMSINEMRSFIQNERRIELAYEDQRWNDIRRWKIAMTLYNGKPNGYNRVMHPIRVGTTGSLQTGVGLVFNYQIENTIRQHVFRDEMYLLPIINDEIRKMPAMLQNPGW